MGFCLPSAPPKATDNHLVEAHQPIPIGHDTSGRPLLAPSDLRQNNNRTKGGKL